jgi:glycosyltransferase involved in cell wall biosynthesis
VRRTALYPLLKTIERISLKRADRLLVLSDFTRSLLEQDAPAELDRVISVSGGVDTEVFCPAQDRPASRRALGLNETTRMLFTARRLEPRMGLENLLKALARLDTNGPHLTIAGTGGLERELRELAAGLDLSDRVHFLGSLSDSDLIEWYRAADLFVLPTVAYEGFGMVTAESLACGTPVLGTPVGATPELLEPLDPGLLSRDADPGSLAIAISDALPRADESLRARCRQYAVEWLSWERAMPRWEAALAAAVSAAGCPQASEPLERPVSKEAA